MEKTKGINRAQFLAGAAAVGAAVAVSPAGRAHATTRGPSGLKHHGVVYTVGAARPPAPPSAPPGCVRTSGKPLAITEFGTCAYLGAPEAGGMGWDIVDYAKDPPEIKGDLVRGERVQAAYLTDLLE
jgi:hypothetical protein